MVEIKLTIDEIRAGVMAGVERQLMNLQNGARPRYGADSDNDWQSNIEGVLGEMAVAKLLEVEYDPNLGNYQAVDVGDLYQVRTSPKPSLLLHPPDKDHHIFIFANGVNGTYGMAGWVYGQEGKRKEFWRDPKGGRPCYFVPKHALNPIEQLPRPAPRGR